MSTTETTTGTSGRVAIVTGGGRGIGAAICRALAADGHAVAINYFSRAGAATALAAEIVANGGRAMAIPGDVSRAAEVTTLVETTARELGPATILVNNAALTDAHKPWFEISEDEWDAMMAVNLKSCFLSFRAVYPAMRDAGWGRVINISSVMYLLGRPDALHYVASKGGMIGFTRTLAREVGPEGITVNAITPGAIRTEAELEMFPDQPAIAAMMAELQSTPRRGEPMDIGHAVAFLASDRAGFITGQTLNVDGGWAMH